MKIAFQNFLTTLKRYKTASVLNIAGLTLAFFAMYVKRILKKQGIDYDSEV